MAAQHPDLHFPKIFSSVGSRLYATKKLKVCGSSIEPFKNKAALVTGGASGIGLECARALLRHGCMGVTIADKDADKGKRALKKIASEFGNNRAIFVKCDVTKAEMLDWAFKNTLKAYDRIDIVVNNAGCILDNKWEVAVMTNIGSCIVGSLLGLQYMARCCHGTGGIVVNICSTSAFQPLCGIPIYTTTQAGILGLTRSLGCGCQQCRTGVNVMGLCAGVTDTDMACQAVNNALNPKFSNELQVELDQLCAQPPEMVACALIDVIKENQSGSVWVVEDGRLPYKMKFPSLLDLRCSSTREAKSPSPCAEALKKLHDKINCFEKSLSPTSVCDKDGQAESGDAVADMINKIENIEKIVCKTKLQAKAEPAEKDCSVIQPCPLSHPLSPPLPCPPTPSPPPTVSPPPTGSSAASTPQPCTPSPCPPPTVSPPPTGSSAASTPQPCTPSPCPPPTVSPPPTCSSATSTPQPCTPSPCPPDPPVPPKPCTLESSVTPAMPKAGTPPPCTPPACSTKEIPSKPLPTKETIPSKKDGQQFGSTRQYTLTTCVSNIPSQKDCSTLKPCSIGRQEACRPPKTIKRSASPKKPCARAPGPKSCPRPGTPAAPRYSEALLEKGKKRCAIIKKAWEKNKKGDTKKRTCENMKKSYENMMKHEEKNKPCEMESEPGAPAAPRYSEALLEKGKERCAKLKKTWEKNKKGDTKKRTCENMKKSYEDMMKHEEKNKPCEKESEPGAPAAPRYSEALLEKGRKRCELKKKAREKNKKGDKKKRTCENMKKSCENKMKHEEKNKPCEKESDPTETRPKATEALEKERKACDDIKVKIAVKCTCNEELEEPAKKKKVSLWNLFGPKCGHEK